MNKHCRYMKIFTIPAVLLGLTVAAWSDAGEDQEPTGPSDSWDTYKIVVERNMFSRQRAPRVERSTRRPSSRQGSASAWRPAATSSSPSRLSASAIRQSPAGRAASWAP